METGTVIAIGVAGVGAWWLYRRMQAQPQPGIVTDPTAAAAMTSAGARTTQTGPTLVSGIARGAIAPRDLPPIVTSVGAIFRKTVGSLLIADANPVPIPPAPPSAAGWSGTAVAAPLGTGASTMGTNPPLSYSINTHFYKGIL
jgi:hypothetical protein